MSFGEILSKAAVNTLLGMGTVFFMLILIIAVIALFKYIPEKKTGAEETGSKEKSAKAKSDGGTAAGSAKTAQTGAAALPGAPDDPLLIPVIMAALAAAMGEEQAAVSAAYEGGSCPYIVRSIRRKA